MAAIVLMTLFGCVFGGGVGFIAGYFVGRWSVARGRQRGFAVEAPPADKRP